MPGRLYEYSSKAQPIYSLHVVWPLVDIRGLAGCRSTVAKHSSQLCCIERRCAALWVPCRVCEHSRKVQQVAVLPVGAYMTLLMACRLYEHSRKTEQLTLLREVDLCVVGVCSLAWGGPHHTYC